jgi:hypothetical protein
MANIENAKNLGQGIYTKSEVDNKVQTIADEYLSGSVGAGSSLTLYSFIVAEPGYYNMQYFYTPHGTSNTSAVVIHSPFNTSYAYGGFYNSASVVGTRYFNVGDELYIRMYGGNSQSWSMHSSRLTITKIG